MHSAVEPVSTGVQFHNEMHNNKSVFIIKILFYLNHRNVLQMQNVHVNDNNRQFRLHDQLMESSCSHCFAITSM